MPSLTTLPPDASPEEVSKILLRDGAVIIRDLMPPGMADLLEEELGPYYYTASTGTNDFSGQSTVRLGALAARSAAVRELLVHPLLLAQCDAVLKPACRRYCVNHTQIIRLKPGAEEQPIHRDRWAWGKESLKERDPEVSTMWAMTDFTRENGATLVVPGSRHWPDDRVTEPDEIAYAEMSRGSCLIFLGSVMHAGGANTTDKDRIGLNFGYVLGWLRQEENQYLSCPPEIAKTFPEELQDLLGYTQADFAMGYYTPPLPPGEGPGTAGPEYALGREAARMSIERVE